MSTLQAEFEAWKRAQQDGYDAWDAVLWATERAAKQNSETEKALIWCIRGLGEYSYHEMLSDPSNGVMRAWEAIRARTGGGYDGS